MGEGIQTATAARDAKAAPLKELNIAFHAAEHHNETASSTLMHAYQVRRAKIIAASI